MANETTLWEWLRDGTNGKNGPAIQGLHINRIENSAAYGMPDVEGMYDHDLNGTGVQFWIENKRMPFSKLMVVDFQPSQIPWLERRWKLGGNAWMLVGIGQGVKFTRHLIRGCDARRFEDSFALEEIEELSVVSPKATQREIIMAASLKAFA